MSKRFQSIFVDVCCDCVHSFFPGSARAAAQSTQTLSVPPDSSRWELEGQAKPAEYQGRKCLFLDGGAAVLKDFELRDGVIDVDVATQAAALPALTSVSPPMGPQL